jgi:hypothetical protein
MSDATASSSSSSSSNNNNNGNNNGNNRRDADDDERRLKAFLSTLCDANAHLDVMTHFDEHRERTQFLLNALQRARQFSSESRILHVANRHSGLLPCGLRRLVGAAGSIRSVCGRQSIVDVVTQVLARNQSTGVSAAVELVLSRVLSLEELNDAIGRDSSTPPIVVLDLFSGLGVGDGALRVAALLQERARASGAAPLKVVPARMRLMAVAIDLSVSRRSVSGFDLSAFDAFKRTEASLGWIATPLHELDFKLMSEPVELFSLAFDAPPSLPRKSEHPSVPLTRTGTVSAILCWYELSDDDGEVFASFDPRAARPKARSQCVFGLREPIVVENAHNAAISIEASLSPTMLFINATPSSEQAASGLHTAVLPRRAPPVQSWHWVMLSDAHRNSTYEAALMRALQMRDPERRLVLDVGGGSGLLSMMAARAGADHVVCVEATAHVALQAREIVATNGFADKVTVVAAHSTAVQVGQTPQLPRAPDILVTEIFDYQLLGEQCLQTFADCHARGLIGPETTVIPRGAVVYAQLAELDRFEAVPMHFADGTTHQFDASAFEVFLEHNVELSWEGVRLEHQPRAKLLSEVFIPFTFDFTAANAAKLLLPRDSVQRVPIVRNGKFNAVVFYYHLHMDSEARLSSAPGASRAWCQAVQHMSAAIPVQAGTPIDIACLHDASRFVFVDANERSGPPGGPLCKEPPKWFQRLKNRERLARQLGGDELGIVPRTRPPPAVLARLRSLAARAAEYGLDEDVCTRVLTNVLTWSV